MTKTWPPKVYGMQQKQFSQEVYIQYDPTLRNKKNLKLST